MIFVTGGAGFIGSNFIQNWVRGSDEPIVIIDKLTYAGNLNNLKNLEFQSGCQIFHRVDICDSESLGQLFEKYKPRAVVHFAAESHVDRSISGPSAFVTTNIVGTFHLLECARRFWNHLADDQKNSFRFLHVSTDEVYGSLSEHDLPFTEKTAFAPNSPYSASKAASDHLVRSYFHTYGFPVLTTHCSNNYGPFQFPEKLIPLVINNALRGLSLPIYGDGLNVRDWLFVSDHCDAIALVLKKGRCGETYNIGGENELSNIVVVDTICGLLDELRPRPDSKSYLGLKIFVQDRPGHDKRYAIDISKIRNELGWRPVENFNSGMRRTVLWYLDQQDWVQNVLSGDYRQQTELPQVRTS